MAGAALAAFLALLTPAWSTEAAAWEALRNGAVALIRHANAPGVGDPPGMRLDDCSSQRNLDEAGRAQARRIGERFKAEGVMVGAVVVSEWCRARETASLAFPDQARTEAAFSSFFETRERSVARTAQALALLSAWRGPGALVAVTHQVNITALTGAFPMSGEAIVVRIVETRPVVVGRLRF
ncbi:MAG: histidine phosphatase family protein [Beijerinckiaceae bacterium]